jgi:hypothetical protein
MLDRWQAIWTFCPQFWWGGWAASFCDARMGLLFGQSNVGLRQARFGLGY